MQDLTSNDVNCSSGFTASIDFYTYNEQGETDDIETPWVDLGSSVGAELTFDYAYARYSSFFFDRMQVQIKTACDDNWITLWDKENLDLATAGSQTAAYTPSCGDWSSETIDLSDYSGVVKVRFRGINGWGNNLYLDNIMLSTTAEPDCNGVPGGDAVPGSDCTTDSGAPGELNESCDCISTNNPPIALDDSYTTGFNEELVVNAANGLLQNDSDPDGDDISVVSYSAAPNGTLNVTTNGSFDYTPDDGFSGTENLSYVLTDGFEITSGSLTITVEEEVDCAGVIGGSAFTDECGDCVGGNTGEEPCEQDCNGDFGGSAFTDECGDCVGGNTGEEPCEQDCNGVFGGDA
ncbi:MAG: cadherin-like domain-containing protein, partial [Flavobacteriales bacterium]|nr:cadherin-like domain-containing protein [Flavobacteriales bacterium]